MRVISVFCAACLAAGVLSMGLASAAMIDVNSGCGITQAGWIAADPSSINDVRFASVGTGVSVDSRDRSAVNGGGAESDMWRDFLFANGSNLAGERLGITIGGLAPDTAFSATIWG